MKVKTSTNTEPAEEITEMSDEKLLDEIRGISGIGEKCADSITEIVRKYIQA